MKLLKNQTGSCVGSGLQEMKRGSSVLVADDRMLQTFHHSNYEVEIWVSTGDSSKCMYTSQQVPSVELSITGSQPVPAAEFQITLALVSKSRLRAVAILGRNGTSPWQKISFTE